MSATVCLRLDVVTAGDVDSALLTFGGVRLERRDGVAQVACAAEHADDWRRILARSGIRATAVAAPPPPAPPLRPARVHDLAPLDATGVIDAVTVRPLTTGEAVRDTARRWPFGRGRRDTARARAILHGEDRAFAWRRIVWADRATLRSAALARARPIVFDRDAVTRGGDRLAYASDGALARWIGR